MLTPTDAALTYLEMLLREANAPENVSVRIEQIEGEAPAKVTIGQQDAGDKHFRFQGRTVLVLDKETADRLEGKALDVEKTSDGVRFVLK